MFIAGILLFEVLGARRFPAPAMWLVVAAFVIGMASPLLPLAGSAGDVVKASILFLSFFILCFSCFLAPESRIGRLVSWTPLRWLGNMSYSYYLIHGLALKAIFLVVGKVLPSLTLGVLSYTALGIVLFSLTLIPSAVLFLLVEKPFSLTMKEGKKKSPDMETPGR